MTEMREINLIPFDEVRREEMKGRVRLWAILIFLVIVGIFWDYAQEQRSIMTMERNNADLLLKNVNVDREVKQLNTLKDKKNGLSRKERVVDYLKDQRSISLIFSELEKIMNGNVSLTAFNFKDDSILSKRTSNGNDGYEWAESGHSITEDDRPGKKKGLPSENGVTVALNGIAKSNVDLASFLEQLSRSELFSEVNLKYSRERVVNSLNVIEFEIETMLKDY